MHTVEELFRADAFRPTLGDASETISLPREAYVSPEFFQFELDALWRREWVCVGHVSQVPNPGDYLPLTLAGDPLVLVHGKDDVIRVMSSVCRHRAMVMTDDEPGNVDHFTCVYHGWTFHLDGELRSAPHMKQTKHFDWSTQALPQLQVELWKGFVFVNYREDAEPLGPKLADLDEVFANWDVENLQGVPQTTMVHDFNWKIFLENAAECYHCDFLHPSWHGCAPTKNTQPEMFPDHPAAVVCTVTTTHRDASFIPPDFTAVFPPLPKLTDEERSIMHFKIVMPNLLIAYYPDGVFYIVLTPMGAKRTRMDFGGLYPAEVMAAQNFQAKVDHSNLMLAPELQEDWDACTKVHAGLESTLAARGRMSGSLEQTVSHFHRWILQRYMAD